MQCYIKLCSLIDIIINRNEHFDALPMLNFAPYNISSPMHQKMKILLIFLLTSCLNSILSTEMVIVSSSLQALTCIWYWSASTGVLVLVY